MKAFVVCAAFLASAVQAEPSATLVHAALRAKWSSFKAEHSKEYHPSEENLRMATFLDNTRFIEEHNTRFHQGLESYSLGHNELADLSLDEIISTRMGVVMPPEDELHSNASLHVASFEVAPPSAVDWRTKNCVQRVKNQGSCGSCYSFSAIGALETAFCNKYGGELKDLSEQQLVDCGGSGCRGGWMHKMFDYLKKNDGSVCQKDYPYTGKDGTCQDKSKTKDVKVEGHKRIADGDEKALEQALATVGTISIAYNAGTQAHAYYKGGVLDIPDCKYVPTHAVLLVGYGNEGGKDYWLLKNSWGNKWGEQGYFKLAKGKNMCGIAKWASYPTAV